MQTVWHAAKINQSITHVGLKYPLTNKPNILNLDAYIFDLWIMVGKKRKYFGHTLMIQIIRKDVSNYTYSHHHYSKGNLLKKKIAIISKEGKNKKTSNEP